MDLNRSLNFSFFVIWPTLHGLGHSDPVVGPSRPTQYFQLWVWCIYYKHIYIYVDYSHFVSPNRGVEGYIRLANSRDDRHPPLPPTPPSQPFATAAAATAAAVGRKQPKHKSKSSMSLIKPNRKQFTQVCTWTVRLWRSLWTRQYSRGWRSPVLLLVILLTLCGRGRVKLFHAYAPRVRAKNIFRPRPWLSPECPDQWSSTFVHVNGLISVRFSKYIR